MFFRSFFRFFRAAPGKCGWNPWPGRLSLSPHFEVDFRVPAFVRSAEPEAGFLFRTSSGTVVFGKRGDSKENPGSGEGPGTKSTN